ncbi:hypothetical protein PHISP_02935 [Aspergillus sp. HF37]|nr:hypothetical protein PHISP_02935 [Aspergillus sp. HF37]
MAIVKHKPPHVDITDHIMQMRAFIKERRASTQPTPRDDARFFDSVAFWQQAYEKSEAEQSRLLDRIYELELRNEALAEKLRVQSGVEAGSDPGSKGKRAKTQVGNGPRSCDAAVVDRVDYREEVTASFMRQFYALQKTLQKKPSRSGVALAAVSLCKVAEGATLDAVYECKPVASRSRPAALQTAQPKLTATIRSVECAFNLLCQALGRLPSTEHGAHDTGLVTYHIVCLYDTAMTALQKHCQTKAQQETTNTKPNARPTKQKNTKSRRAKTARNQGPSPSPSNPETGASAQIARLLGTMALSLDISRGEHQELLEGFLFVLLTRIGKLLCLFMFQDLQLRPDLYADPTRIPLPEGLVGAEVSETSLRAAQMEAGHLIWLLERALAQLGACSPESSEALDGRVRFVAKIKERTQRTLLQAVFGTDTPSFCDALRRPDQPDSLGFEGLQSEREKSGSDWFVQEVWRLLGWEMLQGQG